MRQTGLVESSTPTKDGRWLVVLKIKGKRISGYSDRSAVVGGTASIQDGRVL